MWAPYHKIPVIRALFQAASCAHNNFAPCFCLLMMQAVEQKNKKDFEIAYNRFENLLLQQDALLSTSPYFSLSTWVNAAKRVGSATGSSALCEKNAKTQITYLGPDNNPQTDLRDYADKKWGGLLGTLYLQRWRAFRSSIIDQLDGKQSVPDYLSMEKQWADEIR